MQQKIDDPNYILILGLFDLIDHALISPWCDQLAQQGWQVVWQHTSDQIAQFNALQLAQPSLQGLVFELNDLNQIDLLFKQCQTQYGLPAALINALDFSPKKCSKNLQNILDSHLLMPIALMQKMFEQIQKYPQHQEKNQQSITQVLCYNPGNESLDYLGYTLAYTALKKSTAQFAKAYAPQLRVNHLIVDRHRQNFTTALLNALELFSVQRYITGSSLIVHRQSEYLY